MLKISKIRIKLHHLIKYSTDNQKAQMHRIRLNVLKGISTVHYSNSLLGMHFDFACLSFSELVNDVIEIL